MEDQGKVNGRVELDDVLEDVGRFGIYHYVQYLWIGLPIMFAAIMNANYIFAAEDVDYRCVVPQCDSWSMNATTVPDWWPNTADHRCSRPVLDSLVDLSSFDACSSEMFRNETESCSEWIYSSENSIVAAYNMACKPWMRTLVGTIHNVGMLFSMPLLGYFSDRFGRKLALITSAVGGGALGLMKMFAPNYPTYLTFEFLEAAFGAAVYTTTFVLLVELGGKERAVVSAAYVGFCIAVGEITLALVAQAFPYWKTMIMIIYSPTILFLLYALLISESVRWLLTNGRNEDAKKIILKAAKWNKVQVPDKTLEYLDKISTEAKGSKEKQERIKVKDLFSSAVILQRLAISSFWWFSAAFVYYGLMINSVGLPGNKYLNFILTAAISFPGDLVSMFTLNVFGRKKTLMIAFLFCGVCCVTSSLIPESLWWLGLIVFLLGKMSIATCFNGIYIYTSELFPTNMRSSLVGCCSMFARVGSILAPQTPLLVSVWSSLPSVLFGGAALAAGLLMSFTPETRGRPLPDTVSEAEQLGRAVSAPAPVEEEGAAAVAVDGCATTRT